MKKIYSKELNSAIETWAEKMNKYVLYIGLWVDNNPEILTFKTKYETHPKDGFHITLGYNPNKEFLKEFLFISAKWHYQIIGYAYDEKNEGFEAFTKAPYEGAKRQFITLSYKQSSKPVHTGELNFKPFENFSKGWKKRLEEKTTLQQKGITPFKNFEGEIKFFLRNGKIISLKEIKERFKNNFAAALEAEETAKRKFELEAQNKKEEKLLQLKNEEEKIFLQTKKFIKEILNSNEFIVSFDSYCENYQDQNVSSLEEAKNIIEKFYNETLDEDAEAYIHLKNIKTPYYRSLNYKLFNEEERKLLQYFN